MSATSSPFEHDIRPLVRRFGKAPEDWQRQDLVDLCLEDGIRILNLRYPALDGKLKELRLPINDRAYLERVLSAGERVDGSSLFPGLFHTRESDLYVLPVYRWAYLNPWAPDELEIVCRFADCHGNPAPTPDTVLAKSAERFAERTGAQLHALAELEFYAFTRPEDERFPGKAQSNYHQSSPYLHSRELADEVLRCMSAIAGNVKYCHSEVGYIGHLPSHLAEIDGCRVEQHELEFDLMRIEDLGTWLCVARWLVREVAERHGASVTYLPKLDEGMAGSGMHVHLAIWRDGVNVMKRPDGALSDEALGLVGSVLERAPSMTAFGSTVAASYLRLVPGQEAPTRICWGHQNRASLVRVPLAFSVDRRLDQVMNPAEVGAYPESLSRATVEYRSPDGSAFSLLLLAAIATCAEAASPEDAARAAGLEARPDTDLGQFAELPGSAVAAAHALDKGRAFFEERGFPEALIDHVVRKLEAEQDEALGDVLRALPASERLRESRRLMHKDLHKH
jgi:glutamine synthetase